MSNEKQKEITNDYAEFAKLNDKYLHYKKTDPKYLNLSIALNAMMEKFNDLGLSENVKTELLNKKEEIKSKSEKELQEAEASIDTFISNLIKAIFNYYEATPLSDKEQEALVQKTKQFLSFTGAGLNNEIIFILIKIFYLDK